MLQGNVLVVMSTLHRLGMLGVQCGTAVGIPTCTVHEHDKRKVHMYVYVMNVHVMPGQ